MPTSKLQDRIGQELRALIPGYDVFENTRPAWLVTASGERLELDFCVRDLGVAVEVQGKQHYEFTPFFHDSAQDFLDQQRRDREKLSICKHMGISLIHVSHHTDTALLAQHLGAAERNSSVSPAQCYEALERIRATIDHATSTLNFIRHETTKLKRYGIYPSVPIEQWRNHHGRPRFLYMLFRRDPASDRHLGPDGRRKLYIGCDKARIAEARATVMRTRVYERLFQRISGIERLIRKYQQGLEHI
jgi:hypothetical protein